MWPPEQEEPQPPAAGVPAPINKDIPDKLAHVDSDITRFHSDHAKHYQNINDLYEKSNTIPNTLDALFDAGAAIKDVQKIDGAYTKKLRQQMGCADSCYYHNNSHLGGSTPLRHGSGAEGSMDPSAILFASQERVAALEQQLEDLRTSMVSRIQDHESEMHEDLGDLAARLDVQDQGLDHLSDQRFQAQLPLPTPAASQVTFDQPATITAHLAEHAPKFTDAPHSQTPPEIC